MKFHTGIRDELSYRGEKTIRYVSFQILTIFMISCQLFVFWLSTKGSLFPGEDAMESIVGTGAELIAGLYGITMASYTFFLSRMDALTNSDMTLDYVVASIKNRFKYLLWYITGNVLITLFVSITLMYSPVPQAGEYLFFYRLFCNEFVLALAFSIVLILYYAILVIDPNCLEKEARRLKRKMSHGPVQKGGAVEFIALYDRIETQCARRIPAGVLSQLQENKGNRFEYTLALLQEQKVFDLVTIYNLTRIHRYYECMVNCSGLTVTREMLELARFMAAALEKFPEGKG